MYWANDFGLIKYYIYVVQVAVATLLIRITTYKNVPDNAPLARAHAATYGFIVRAVHRRYTSAGT